MILTCVCYDTHKAMRALNTKFVWYIQGENMTVYTLSFELCNIVFVLRSDPLHSIMNRGFGETLQILFVRKVFSSSSQIFLLV